MEWEWIAQCPQCQAKRANIKEKQEYSPIEVTEPLELVGMDLVGKLTVTDGGNQYICVMVDYFTKWAEAYPLKTKTAEEVTNCILDFFYKFGAPQRLLTDQGSEFCNKVNSGLCETLAIKRSLCSAYHPQTNGLVEKLNGTIQRSLNKMVAGHPKRWDQVLQSTMFGLRTKKQLTTQYSPYYLMFGREARYPSEVPKEYLVKEDKVSRLVATEEIHEGLNKQKAVFTEVNKNMKRSQDNVRKRKVKKGQEDSFQVGDQVLRRNVRQEQIKGGKLDDDWLGPYTILELEGKKAVLAKGTTKLQTNIDHLTHYIQPEERIPAKLQKLSDLSPLAGPQHTQTPTTQTPTTQTPTTQTPTTQQGEAQMAPKDPELLIRQIWTGRRKQTLWCKFGPYKVYSENLMNLAPGKWLEGEIVNSYITMVGRKAGALTLDSYLMTSLWEGTHKGSLRSLDLLKYDVAVGAVCSHGHWTLIIMYLKERRSLFVDPFGATDAQIQKCKDVTRALVRKKCPKIGRWACATVAHPKQQDSLACGVFVCKLAEQILSGQNIDYAVDQKGVAMLRLDMSMSLVTNSDDLSQLCRACGELSSGAEGDIDTWVCREIHVLLLEDWDAPWIGYLNIIG
ncbi:uncharacterized protein [Pseudochaenichthys georgianus]|uniref:uncharacterized protein n=1 Tax=Pseudochaenichthys georgianus TaxID=52239 RepID=UPI0039C04A2A